MGRKIAVRLLLLVLLLAALYGQQEIFAQEDSQGTHAEKEDTDDLEGGGDEDEQTKADTDHSDQEGQEETEQEQPPEGDGDDTQEKPPLPYEVSYGEPDGEEHQEKPPLPYEVSYGEPDGEEQYYTVKPQVTILHPGETGETVYILENVAGALTEGRISQPGGQAVIEPEAFGEGENRLRVWTEYAPPGKEIQTLYERELIFKIDTCPPSLDMWVEGGEGWHQYQADVGYKVEENSVGSGIKYIAYYVNGQEQEQPPEGDGDDTQEKPPLPYEVSYGEPDGEEQSAVCRTIRSPAGMSRRFSPLLMTTDWPPAACRRSGLPRRERRPCWGRESGMRRPDGDRRVRSSARMAFTGCGSGLSTGRGFSRRQEPR